MKFLVSFIVKFVIFSVFIFLLGIVGINLLIKSNLFQKSYKVTSSQLSPTPITDEEDIECVKSGGMWMTSPLGIEFFCNSIMPDGGKICRSNLDCVSDTCIVNEGDNVAKCALYKASYGCYIKLITSRGFSKDQARKGEIIREQLCVD